ncbi:hypothetical protein [Nitritalea halalkaliphila]|nr:hypothetical protein [Nitritalea halalkaliphila]
MSQKQIDTSPNRPYWRFEIDQVFAARKAQMHQEAQRRGGGVALFEDCYTGKTLRGGEDYHYEHIFSAEEIFMRYRDRLTNAQIAELVNCPENIGVTLATINRSKGKKSVGEWLADTAKLAQLGVDPARVRAAARRAEEGIARAFQRMR